MTRTSGAGIRFGAQTYTWQLSMDRYRGRVDHMVGVTADAGFTGFEPEVVMLGDDWSAEDLVGPLQTHGIELAALCLVEAWRAPVESPEEEIRADRAIEAVASLPGALINLVQYPGVDRADLRERQDHALSCLSAVAGRAAARGVGCAFHPNSPAGSVFRTVDDYDYLIDRLPEQIGLTPDTGHLVRGGLDPLTYVTQHRERVRHLHIKDVYEDGTWAPTGAGVVDVPAVVDFLSMTSFEGWVVFEDESEQARVDPDAATRRNGAFAAGLQRGTLQ